MYRDELGKGKSLVDSFFETFTGKMLQRLGFAASENLEIVEDGRWKVFFNPKEWFDMADQGEVATTITTLLRTHDPRLRRVLINASTRNFIEKRRHVAASIVDIEHISSKIRNGRRDFSEKQWNDFVRWIESGFPYVRLEDLSEGLREGDEVVRRS